MRKIIIILYFFIASCSFDNKTGIWQNENIIVSKENEKFRDFKTLYSKEKVFDAIINPPSKLTIALNKAITNLKWTDEFYQANNNLDNFSYKNQNKIIFKSKKLTKHKVNEKILFDGENLILNDNKGNIIVYSVEKLENIFSYNFYKKKYKKLKKKLNILLEDNIVYVADDFGYLYALDYLNKKLLWAHNYKIPFRSNLKIVDNKIILSDQNNSILIVNKKTGVKLRTLPTEEKTLKNEFINSFALIDNKILFLNTFGTIYALDRKNLKINWFLNLNQSLDLNLNNLFYANSIVSDNKNVVISSIPFLYILDSNTGTTISREPITSISKPIITKQGLFLITPDNLLVYKDLQKQKIIYSISIADEVANYLNNKKKSIIVKSFFIVNGELFIFLENSYLVRFDLNGKIKKITKLPSKIETTPIFINNSILYLSKKNKLIILN